MCAAEIIQKLYFIFYVLAALSRTPCAVVADPSLGNSTLDCYTALSLGYNVITPFSYVDAVRRRKLPLNFRCTITKNFWICSCFIKSWIPRSLLKRLCFQVQGKRFVYRFVCDLKELVGFTAAQLNEQVTNCAERRRKAAQSRNVDEYLRTPKDCNRSNGDAKVLWTNLSLYQHDTWRRTRTREKHP